MLKQESPGFSRGEQVNETASFTLTLPRELELTANDRLHWREKAARVKALRQLAAAAKASQGRTVRFDRARCVCLVEFRTNHRRDAGNWHDTAKPCIDGMVDGPAPRLPGAALWPHRILDDDDSAHLVGPDMRIGIDPGLPPKTLRITFTFTPLETP